MSAPGNWRLVWDQASDEEDGGWIATNGRVFMNPTALEALNPELFHAMVADLQAMGPTNEPT